MGALKILQAFDFLSLPHGGGTVDIVYKLSKALAARGHEVTICTGDHELDTSYLNGLGNVGLKMYHSYFNRHGIYLMPGLVKLDVRNYDIIHLHCYRSIQNIVLAQKATMYRVPYIIDAHGSTVDLPGRKRILRRLYDMVFGIDILNHAKYLITETETGVNEYARLGFTGGKVRLQHPLLDTSEFDVLPDKGAFRERHRLGSEFIVLFLGRLHPTKGIDTLVEAAMMLSDRGVNVRLVIAGQDDGLGRTLFNMMYNYNKRSPFLMPGFLNGADKLAVLADADVLVQPSKNEAGARPSLEAIMCGTPVIVSRDTGAGREIAKFDGGLLFKSGDAVELANAIREIIDRPEEAKARTEKAREYIEANLSLDKQIGEYEKLYQEARSLNSKEVIN